MIVDLARNDLGRVCEFGSVQVPALFAVEAHPGLFHLVSTVTGRLRADVDLADVVRATFPPASVTGAPKPRVMQAIEDLEPVRRGVYCGAIGWVDGDRGPRRARGRDPHVHDRGRADVSRCRRRHRRRLATRRRVGGDRAEGGAAARGRRDRSHDAVPLGGRAS